MTELAVGERCGITIPTRFAFREAGYDAMLEAHRRRSSTASRRSRRSRFRSRTRAGCATTSSRPSRSRKADFFVNCPKFKAHPWTTVTFSMKNYIGIQDDRHRLIDHDHELNEKIADLQYIIQPQFIAIDAIIAGEGRMLTPIPSQHEPDHHGQQPGRVRRGRAARSSAIDPLTVEHIRLAHERGFGTDGPRRRSRSPATSRSRRRRRARRASRSASSASRSTSRARTSRRTPARRPSGATTTTAGADARARSTSARRRADREREMNGALWRGFEGGRGLFEYIVDEVERVSRNGLPRA